MTQPTTPPDDSWPYDDLELLTPTCPWCGQPPQAAMVGANVHPQAFCGNDDCPAFAWDPSVPAARLVLGAAQLVETSTDPDRSIMRPVTLHTAWGQGYDAGYSDRAAENDHDPDAANPYPKD